MQIPIPLENGRIYVRVCVADKASAAWRIDARDGGDTGRVAACAWPWGRGDQRRAGLSGDVATRNVGKTL